MFFYKICPVYATRQDKLMIKRFISNEHYFEILHEKKKDTVLGIHCGIPRQNIMTKTMI